MTNHKFVSRARICRLSAAVMACLAGSANAGVLLSTDKGWQADVSGSVPVFLVNADLDRGEDASRIQSGFNPANLTFVVQAPSTEGITVSGRVQINTHLQGSQTQNGGLFESRVAELQVDGDFGTFNIGKGFGIFGSTAIGDLGSGLGVGLLGGGADTANATNGRIGAGAVFAKFKPRIIYTTPDLGGVKLRLGLFNPDEPADTSVETPAPGVEGQLDYAKAFGNGGIKFWAGFMWQEVKLTEFDFDYDMRGYDIGTHLDLGGFGLTLAYTDTEGVGADGIYAAGGIDDAQVDATQWYAEADYQFGKTTLGISYGEGEQEATVTAVGAAADVTNELGMVFMHYKATASLTLMAEYQDFRSDAAPGDYNAYIVGFQYDF